MENFVESLKIAADLRTHAYKAIKISAAETGALVTAVGDTTYGVNQTKSNSGQNITVVTAGRTRMFAGGTIAAGNKLTVTASATFIAAGSGDTVYGSARSAVASGGYFQGLFFGGLAAETITQT